MSTKNFVRTALAAAAVVLSGATSAAVITLNFEGLANGEEVRNFYNGGTGSLGSAGTNHGIAFGDNALALIDGDAGGTGNFAHEPSPSTIMFFLTGGSAVLNYAPGFDTGFSFWYTSRLVGGSVTVYDDLDAGGNAVGTIQLPAQGTNCVGDPTGAFCNWAIGSLAFAGVARSIDFGGTRNQIGFDDITFGSAVPGGPTGNVPEPTSIALVGLALAGLALTRRR